MSGNLFQNSMEVESGRRRGRVGQRARQFPITRVRRLGEMSFAQERRILSRLNRRTGGFIGLEKKFADTSIVSTAMSVSTDLTGGELDPATLLGLNSVAIGDTESTRDGRVMHMTNLVVKGQLRVAPKINTTAGQTQNRAFLALVLDTQTNGAQLNSEDVYVNPSGDALLNTRPVRNLQYIKRFRVLWSKELVLPIVSETYDGTNIETGGVSRSFQFFINWKKKIKTIFTGTTAVVGSIGDNSLHMIGFANSTDVLCDYNARLRFVG